MLIAEYCIQLWIRPVLFSPYRTWDWFAQSWIRPPANFLCNPFYITELAQFKFALGSEGKMGEDKTGGEIFPVYSRTIFYDKIQVTVIA